MLAIIVVFGWITAALNVTFVTIVVSVFMFGLLAAIGVAFSGAMYRMLVLERDTPIE